MNDNVKNPKHYQGRNGIEAIDVHRNFMNDEQLTGYHLGNTLKYLLRYRKKKMGLRTWRKQRFTWIG